MFRTELYTRLGLRDCSHWAPLKEGCSQLVVHTETACGSPGATTRKGVLYVSTAYSTNCFVMTVLCPLPVCLLSCLEGQGT